MRCLAICCCTAALIGCARSGDERAADTVPDTTTSAGMVAAPAPISLAAVAGRWNVKVMPAGSDSVMLTQVLTAMADTAGWMMVFPDSKPIPLRIVAVAGDSIVTEAGPYSSVLRKGVRVRTRGVFRLRGETLVGMTVATYEYTPGPDSVFRFRTEGTRAP
ncbi:MAG: hypothetical protein WKG32_16965 [Gemmatimonadaceae bacterium]